MLRMSLLLAGLPFDAGEAQIDYVHLECPHIHTICTGDGDIIVEV